MHLNIRQLTPHKLKLFMRHLPPVHDPDACLHWSGSPGSRPKFVVSSRRQVAPARLAYVIAHPQETLTASDYVYHTCTNRYPLQSTDFQSCCNPRHLARGTLADLDAHRIAAGRAAMGSRLPHTRLTPTAVSTIRDQYRRGGCTYRMLAEQYQVSTSAIQLVVSHKTWRYV